MKPLCKFIALLLLFCNQLVDAQHLKRKASLGLALYNATPDSLMRFKNVSGALIKNVFPHTTAQEMGIQNFDFIISLNQRKVNSTEEFLAMARELRENDSIILTILRNEEKIILRGIAKPKPYEQHNLMEITYGEFAYDKGYVRTITKAPKNQKPKATLYFLQGISCYTLDNMKANDPTKLAIDALVLKGYRVYTIEKSSIGDNLHIAPCETMGYFDEIKLFKAGYAHLLSMKQIDTSTIFLFGHSLGGLAAPQLAAMHPPKGIIVYGTGLKPWSEYLLDSYKIQLQYYGEDLGKIVDTLEAIKPDFYSFFYDLKSEEEILQSNSGLLAMQYGLSYDVKSKTAIAGRTLQFHKEINKTNLAEAWKKSNCAVLAIYGGADIAANNELDHVAIVDYVNRLRPNTATFMLEPETNHTFQKIGTMQQYIEMQQDPASYQLFAESHFNEELFDKITHWINKQL